MLKRIDFNTTLIQGMLSFLLFAGALHVDVGELAEQKWVVSILAVVGVTLSMFLFGTAIYYGFAFIGQDLDYAWCLLFGALISPTDPIAVIAILKQGKVPRELETIISSESLFNDGIGVVAFLVMHEIAVAGRATSPMHFVVLFIVEAMGGAGLGLLLGWITYRMLKSVDNYQVEVLLTLALVMGGYAFASSLHTSGPIAIVVAGLFIGNQGRQFAMSNTTREHLDAFWELLDEVLNAFLFVLIGLEVLVLSWAIKPLIAALFAIPALLLARWVSVGLPLAVISLRRTFTPGTLTVMTWGGLRGGISVALALSLPSGPQRELIVVVTYLLVMFSILAQGLTVRPVVKHALKNQ